MDRGRPLRAAQASVPNVSATQVVASHSNARSLPAAPPERVVSPRPRERGPPPRGRLPTHSPLFPLLMKPVTSGLSSVSSAVESSDQFGLDLRNAMMPEGAAVELGALKKRSRSSTKLPLLRDAVPLGPAGPGGGHIADYLRWYLTFSRLGCVCAGSGQRY